MQTDDAARWIGTDTRTQWQSLRCGPLALHFDPATAALRNIRLGEREVVRAIYVAVRDRNWDTIEPQIADIDLVAANDGFRLTFTALCREREIDFRWYGEIVGEANGGLRFSMDGEAHSTFWRNRIGFCILHPIRECAGQPCIVTTADGATRQGVFPDLIAPHQPFLNMRAIRHEALPGVWAELTFDGDIFEMEDQRNWTDASYKTYCTPLALPYPVEVPQGTRVAQSVAVILTGQLSSKASAPADDEPVTLRLSDAPPVPLPQIGLGIASHHIPLSEREIERLATLNLSHLRIDLMLNERDWDAHLQRAIREALALGAQLEIALFLTDDGMETQLAALAAAVTRLHPPVVRWLVFDAAAKTTPERCLRAARAALASLTPNALFGGGTNAYYAELNRNPPARDALDFVCWSINPQVHAFDTASIMENLEAQAATIKSARAIYGDLPIVISPITLKPRFNPNATGPAAPSSPDALPPQVDERQCTLIGAVWTLLSLKHLFESGVQSVTYYETTGWRGVMESEGGSLLPEQFLSVPGGLFPLHSVFADIGLFAPGAKHKMWTLASSAPSRVDGLAIRIPMYTVTICANLTPAPQTLRLLLPASIQIATLWQLDSTSARLYSHDPARTFKGKLEVQNGVIERVLPPYACVRLQWWEDNHG